MEYITEYINTTPLYVQMAVFVGIALILSTILTSILFAVVAGWAKRSDSYTLDTIRKRSWNAFFWVVTFALIVVFWNGLQAVDPDAEPGDPWYLRPLVLVARTILYIAGALLLIRIVNIAADTVRHRYSIDEQNNLRERKILTQLQYIQRIVGIVIFIVTFALVLLQFDAVRSVGTALLTSAGVGGIIIGFAAQKSIANLLAGFQIAFTQPIRIDDALIVNGEFGRVEEITLTYVTLKIWDQRRMIVPLNVFIDETFQNWTRSTTQLIGSVFMYVDYTFPVEKLREEAQRFVETQELWDKQVFGVAVTDNNADVMTIRIIASAADSGLTFNLRCAIREHLIGWIQQHYPDHLPKTRLEMSPSTTTNERTPAASELPIQEGDRS
ncbi:small-conductance mechanosensitive channel [Lewinella marina]|uniref:Mechanosensitive ion channel protein MscS n=1 Tax=Neolewinella marina TaxID=438751 RepID=A0A2G0CG75_9BACT|nr:mechanosensitive ion channel domain-containing protein [Neolewinella marina]NJB86572.1 small-conductance mechanosensitive channel [Neolewinella marina]PHK98976.1 mechanosensitive ion channel protein MscS [Neolewinella marina]